MKGYILIMALLLVAGAEAQHIRDEGSERRATTEEGKRRADREEILNSLKNLENRSLAISVNIVPLFYKYFPIQVEPQMYFKYPLMENGVVYTTQMEYYKQVAQAKGKADGLYYVEVIKRDMVNLIGFAMVVGDVLEKLKLTGMIGLQDIEHIAKNINYSKLPSIPYSLSECRAWDMYMVKCGDCVYDFSMRMGFPEIVCKGMRIIASDSVMGYSAKMDVNRISSIEDVFNQAKAQEGFQSVVSAFSSYTRTTNVSAVEGLALKSSLLKAYAEGKPQINIALSMMKNGEKPFKILETLNKGGKP